MQILYPLCKYRRGGTISSGKTLIMRNVRIPSKVCVIQIDATRIFERICNHFEAQLSMKCADEKTNNRRYQIRFKLHGTI